MQHTKLEQVKRATLAMQRHNWEQGTVAQAFLEAGDTEIAILMAVEAVNRQTDEGRCAQMGNDVAAADPCAIGEALIFAVKQTGDPALRQGLDKLLHWALKAAPRNAEGIIYHLCPLKQMWVDSFYMLPPFLACAGEYDEALKQVDGLWALLLDPEKQLLSHQWDDEARSFPRKAVWGVGNGWAMAAMARLIDLLPESYAAQRERLISRVKLLLDAALRHQRADGLFHDVLDDPTTFREVNAGQMFAYTMYRGMRRGWLPDSYADAAERIRTAVQDEVDSFGLVRNVCGVPFFDRPHVAPEGQAFYIMMETQREKWGHGVGA